MSELHNRLAHLVNYSSQLIFVSGDTVADQQRTLSDFLSSQQENTEISFVTAHANKKPQDYRSEICRQLGGHTVGSFVRPLKQLLVDLSPEAGPYLVCITSADALAPSFLQELWDWTIQSQQSEQNIHLNIILFGTTEWAESSQEWLPSQNSHKPVLLSSQSVNSSGFDVNALEALMANERSWFNLSSGPIVTNKWFIGGVLSLFFVIFIGLLSWQYPAQINQLLAGADIQESNLPAFDIPQEVSSQRAILTEEVNQELLNETSANNYTTELEIIKEPTNTEQSIAEKSITESMLVRSWKQDKSLAENGVELVSQSAANNPQAQIDASTIKPIQTKTTEPTDQIERSTTRQPKADTFAAQGDFQVPDIISIEQLDERLGNNLEMPEKEEIVAQEPIKSPIDENVANNSANNPNDSQSSIDYRFDETTLLELPSDSILLQLSGIQNPVVLENYLASNNLKTYTWVYETQRYGGPWYVVLYRQSFDSIDAALNRLSSLPEDIQNAGPFAKSVNQIQQEIRRR